MRALPLPLAVALALLLPAAGALTQRVEEVSYTGYAEVFTACQLEAHVASPGQACFHGQPGEYRVILEAAADDGSFRSVGYRFLDEGLHVLAIGGFCQATTRFLPVSTALVELAVADPVAGFSCGVDPMRPGLTGTLRVVWQAEP